MACCVAKIDEGYIIYTTVCSMILGHSHCHFQPVKDLQNCAEIWRHRDRIWMSIKHPLRLPQNSSAPETSWQIMIYSAILRILRLHQVLHIIPGFVEFCWLLLQYPRLVIFLQPHDACNKENSLHLLATIKGEIGHPKAPLWTILEIVLGQFLFDSKTSRMPPSCTSAHEEAWALFFLTVRGEIWRWKQYPQTFSRPNHSNTLGLMHDACKGFHSTKRDRHRDTKPKASLGNGMFHV